MSIKWGILPTLREIDFFERQKLNFSAVSRKIASVDRMNSAPGSLFLNFTSVFHTSQFERPSFSVAGSYFNPPVNGMAESIFFYRKYNPSSQ